MAELRTFDDVLHECLADALHGALVNGGFIEKEQFISHAASYYADITLSLAYQASAGRGGLLGEPENAMDIVKRRATVVWADEVSPRAETPGEMKRLGEPLTDEEKESIEKVSEVWGSQ